MLFFGAARCHGAQLDIDSLRKNIHNIFDPQLVINNLLALPNPKASNTNFTEQDKIFQLAFDIATYTMQDSLKLKVCKKYFSLPFSVIRKAKNVTIGKAYLSMAKQQRNEGNMSLAYSALATCNISPVERKETIKQAMYYANLSKSNEAKCQANLLTAEAEDINNNKLDAYRHYLDGLQIAEMNGMDDYVLLFYTELIQFFGTINVIDKAEFYAKKMTDYYNAMAQKDSLSYFKLLIEHSLIDKLNNNIDQLRIKCYKVMQYANRNNAQDLANNQLVIYRSALLDNNNFKELTAFYTKDFPSEYENLKKGDSLTYCRIQSIICEQQGHTDSAIYWLKLGEQLLISQHTGTIQQAHFYKRLAEFEIRIGNKSKAMLHYIKVNELARQARYYSWVAESANKLDDYYIANNNIGEAYKFKTMSSLYTDSMHNSNRQEELLALEFSNEIKNKELLAEKLAVEKSKKHNIQYTLMLLTLLVLLLLLVFLGFFTVRTGIIKAIGFVFFLFMFELIIFVADNKIHHYTHGEPLKTVGIKIGLMAILLPLHHFLEHSVIHYFLKKERIDTSSFSWKKLWAQLLGKPVPDTRISNKSQSESLL